VSERARGEKRPVFDAAKAAYHGYQLAEQLSGLRRGWDGFKAALFEFFIFAAAAGLVLIAGRYF
jgi:hypothetical protein